MNDAMMSEICRNEELAFAAVVLAPRRMKAHAKQIHAQWDAAYRNALAAIPISDDVASMSDDQLLAELSP